MTKGGNIKEPNAGHLVGLIILALICPFAATFVVAGCTTDGWFTLLLCGVMYLPGLIHSLYVVGVWYDQARRRKAGKLLKRKGFIFSSRVLEGTPVGMKPESKEIFERLEDNVDARVVNNEKAASKAKGGRAASVSESGRPISASVCDAQDPTTECAASV